MRPLRLYGDPIPQASAEIRVWALPKAPKVLRERVNSKAEWLVLISPEFVSSGIERLLLRWHIENH